MNYSYQTKGVCSRQMDFEIDENNIIQSFEVIGGCNGNLQGIKSLILGMKAEDVIKKLRGIKCGPKQTSCPDQLAQALELYLSNK